MSINVFISWDLVKGLDFHHFIAFPEKMLTAEQTLENIKSLFTSYLEKEPSKPIPSICRRPPQNGILAAHLKIHNLLLPHIQELWRDQQPRCAPTDFCFTWFLEFASQCQPRKSETLQLLWIVKNFPKEMIIHLIIYSSIILLSMSFIKTNLSIKIMSDSE